MKIIITEEEVEVLRRLFQHPAGQDARDMIYQKFVNVNDFDNDPYIHANNAGQRGFALLLCACADASKPVVVGTEQRDYSDTDNTID